MSYTRINSKWIIDLSAKCKTLRLLEDLEKITVRRLTENYCDIGLCENFKIQNPGQFRRGHRIKFSSSLKLFLCVYKILLRRRKEDLQSGGKCLPVIYLNMLPKM